MKMLFYIEPKNNGVCFRILKICGGRCGKIIPDVNMNKIYWIRDNNSMGSDFYSVKNRMLKYKQPIG